MSNYFQAQEKNSKERYLQKLERAGISFKDDPNSPDKSGEWSSDGTWATVENVAILFLIK